jgi:hypothetical protein
MLYIMYIGSCFSTWYSSTAPTHALCTRLTLSLNLALQLKILLFVPHAQLSLNLVSKAGPLMLEHPRQQPHFIIIYNSRRCTVSIDHLDSLYSIVYIHWLLYCSGDQSRIYIFWIMPIQTNPLSVQETFSPIRHSHCMIPQNQLLGNKWSELLCIVNPEVYLF